MSSRSDRGSRRRSKRTTCSTTRSHLLDRWAATAGIADRLIVEGVTYWFRVREPLWHWLHERLLWRYALAAIEGDQPFESVAAPADEEALIDVVRALGRPIEVAGGPEPEPAGRRRSADDADGARRPRPLRAVVRGVVRRLRPKPESAASIERQPPRGVARRASRGASRRSPPRASSSSPCREATSASAPGRMAIGGIPTSAR